MVVAVLMCIGGSILTATTIYLYLSIYAGDRLNPFRIFGARSSQEPRIQPVEELPPSDAALPIAAEPPQAEGIAFVD